MAKVSVIIPARDAAATIPRTLAALARQDLDEPYEVIVVDDGSEDDTAPEAERGPGPVRVLCQGRLGPAAARNRGAAAATAPVLAFTDADCFPHAGWLSAGLRALAGADLVQGEVRAEPYAARGPFDRSLRIDHETGLYESANLFVRRQVFDRVGGFRGWLVPRVGRAALAEDVWFGWQVRRAGFRTAFCAEAVVEHAILPGTPVEFIVERLRLEHFADMAAQFPEIRERKFYAKWFLTRRTAFFDAALVGAAVAALVRSPLPLALTFPYGRLAVRQSSRWGRRAPAALGVGVVADTVGFAALVRGSLHRRTLVL